MGGCVHDVALGRRQLPGGHQGAVVLVAVTPLRTRVISELDECGARSRIEPDTSMTTRMFALRRDGWNVVSTWYR
jgi:hypothetical protein